MSSITAFQYHRNRARLTKWLQC